MVTKRLYEKEKEWSRGQIKTCRKTQHVKIDNMKEMPNSICGNTAVGGNYNSTCDNRVIQAVHAAITVLERNFEEKNFSNPKEFIIAAVITGYVYNEMPELIDDRMRPVDDYDVIRLYLMLLTMKQYGIEGDEVLEIRGHASRYISVGNIRINLPVVNKHCMTVDEVLVHFRTAGISSIGQIQIQIPEKSKGKKKIYTDRTTVYETIKLRDLKSDVFSFLKFKEGNVEEIRERLEELRNINEEKYAALEKKYSKHDIEQKLF